MSVVKKIDEKQSWAQLAECFGSMVKDEGDFYSVVTKAAGYVNIEASRHIAESASKRNKSAKHLVVSEPGDGDEESGHEGQADTVQRTPTVNNRAGRVVQEKQTSSATKSAPATAASAQKKSPKDGSSKATPKRARVSSAEESDLVTPSAKRVKSVASTPKPKPTPSHLEYTDEYKKRGVEGYDPTSMQNAMTPLKGTSARLQQKFKDAQAEMKKIKGSQS